MAIAPTQRLFTADADVEPPLPMGTRFEAPVAQYWVRHGYAVVYADPRGTWRSEGDTRGATHTRKEHR